MTRSAGLRICFFADFRSPIARSWIGSVVAQGHDVLVVSTYPTDQAMAGVRVERVHVAGSQFAMSRTAGRRPVASGARTLPRSPIELGAAGRLLVAGRRWIAPAHASLVGRRTQHIVEEFHADLVHAMRIPYEAVVATSATPAGTPLVVSTWGNDLTLNAPKNPALAAATRRSLGRADALLADCRRDIELSRDWGFASGKPHCVLAGGGGIDLTVFNPSGAGDDEVLRRLGVPSGGRILLNARGNREYVRNDAFLTSLPPVLAVHDDVTVVCVGLHGVSFAERLVHERGLRERVVLLPPLPHDAMPALFRAAEVTVSPSTHDGTPNSLLEAMAAGSFPVAGDIDSVREWLDDGVNGILCDPSDPRSLTAALNRALDSPQLRQQAALHNLQLVRARAERSTTMERADRFYRQVVAAAQEDADAPT